MSLKFGIGDLTIHRIIEQETTFLPALDLFPALTADLLAENRQWMRQAGALDAEDILILCFQSYVVKTPHHTILIDSCIGNDKERPARPKWHMKSDDTYMRALAAAGVSVADIDYVMCTHLHVDHVGWNTMLEGGKWLPTFPNARYLMGRVEYEHWSRPQGREDMVAVFGDSVQPVFDAGLVDLVETDARICDEIDLIPTIGHTPGHVSVRIRSRGEEALITGDFMHHPCQIAHPEWASTADSDPEMGVRTRERMFETLAGTPVLVIGTHFAGATAGRIVRDGATYRLDV